MLKFNLPARAVLLLFLVVGGSMYVGLMLGLWTLPVVVTVICHQHHAFSEIPVGRYGGALAPSWLDKDGGVFTSNRVNAAGMILCVICLRYVGNIGDRIWRRLVIKLGWATPEHLAEFYKEHRWI